MHLGIENCTQLGERCSPGRLTGQMSYRKSNSYLWLGEDIPQPPLSTPKGQKFLASVPRGALHGSLCHSADQEALCPPALAAAFENFVLQGFCSSGCCCWTFTEPTVGHSLGFWVLWYLSKSQCMWLQLEMMTDMALVTGQDFQYFGKWTSYSLFVRRQNHPKEQI